MPYDDCPWSESPFAAAADADRVEGQLSNPATTRPAVARPETVLVCELIGGDFLLNAVPDGPLAYLAGRDADMLRAALESAFRGP